MKNVRITMALLAVLGVMLFAAPSRAQEASPKQNSAVVAVHLGYFTYQAHAIKQELTANDTEIENLIQQLMEDYAAKLNNTTLSDINAGNLPDLDKTNIRKLTTAIIANQTEFSEKEIDITTAHEMTGDLLQQRITQIVLSALFAQQMP